MPRLFSFESRFASRFASSFVHATLLAVTLPTLCAAQTNTAPIAAVLNVTDSFFGTTITDPYRYFENKKSPEVLAWMKAHNDQARATLAKIPGRDAMLANLTRYDASVSDRVGSITRLPGDLYFLERRAAADNQFKLYMRRGLTGTDTLLVDPEALEKSTGKPHAINWYTPSPDGSVVAYGLSQGGSEEAVLHLLNTATGKPIGQPISRANYGGVDWTADSKTLVFNRLQEMRKGMPETQKYQRSQMMMLTPGQAASTARVAFGDKLKGVDIAPVESPTVSLTHDGRWAIGAVYNGTQREIGLFIAPQAAVLAASTKVQPKWQRIVSRSDAVTSFSYFNDTLYLVTHAGAPRSQVLALDLKAPQLAKASVVVVASDRVVIRVAAAADALYVETRDGNIKRLFKRAYEGATPAVEVRLPVEGSFALGDGEGGASAADPRLPGVLIELESWTRARQVFAVAADGKVSNTGMQPAGRFDALTDIEATEVKVPSHDGALVPMSIIHRKGVKLDGSNPTLLYGYASYGITEEPFFSPSRLAWMDAGGVYAIANPRGSSVYGNDWYKGGFQATKPNTWKDFIACAEFLIAQKYTQPSKLGILGGSAGGILVGRAMTERPDLFAAVIPAVGALDTLRFETTANGVPNIPEFGSVKNAAGFKALQAMSTYDNVKPGVAYPAVMLTHGVNDPRVDVWESTKTAARLKAATSSGKPVLMRLDFDAGHGIGNTKKQQLTERADNFSFLLWQMGVAGYQP
jgi:prolyl oligopeptidase